MAILNHKPYGHATGRRCGTLSRSWELSFSPFLALFATPVAWVGKPSCSAGSSWR